MTPSILMTFATERLNFGSAPVFRTRSSPFFVRILSEILFVKSHASLCTCCRMPGNILQNSRGNFICLRDSQLLLNLRHDAISFHFGRGLFVLGSSIPVVCGTLSCSCLCQSEVSSVCCYVWPLLECLSDLACFNSPSFSHIFSVLKLWC